MKVFACIVWMDVCACGVINAMLIVIRLVDELKRCSYHFYHPWLICIIEAGARWPDAESSKMPRMVINFRPSFWLVNAANCCI